MNTDPDKNQLPTTPAGVTLNSNLANYYEHGLNLAVKMAGAGDYKTATKITATLPAEFESREQYQRLMAEILLNTNQITRALPYLVRIMEKKQDPVIKLILSLVGLDPENWQEVKAYCESLGTGNKQEAFHLIEWDEVKSARLNNWSSGWSALQDDYFSKQVGSAVIRLAKAFGRLHGRVLDYGCGPGYLIDCLFGERFSCEAMEFSIDAVYNVNRRFRENPLWKGARLFKGGPLPYEDGCLDFIFCVEVIEHVLPKHMSPMLRELRRILKKTTGTLLVTTPCNENLDRSMACCPECGCVFHKVQHVSSFTPTSLQDLMERHGFKTQQCAPIDFCRLQNFPSHNLNEIQKLFGQGPHLFWIGQAGES